MGMHPKGLGGDRKAPLEARTTDVSGEIVR